MAQAETVLVATVVHPTRRFRIDKGKFDEANAKAKAAGKKSPFIVQEEGCEGGLSFDQLPKEEQEKRLAAQKATREAIKTKEAEKADKAE